MNQQTIWLLEQHSNQRALERIVAGEFYLKNHARLKSLREAGLIELKCEGRHARNYVVSELGQKLLEEELPAL